ncbi:MAG: cysteine desulfurase family protein [Oceanicaulis sp.]
MSVYLDHNASAPVRPEAAAAVAVALAEGGNPSSVHGPGRAARARVERSRAVIAKSICARGEDLVFTSGGTEANNLAVHAARLLGAQRIVISAIEHDAVRAAAKASGLPVTVWPVTGDGRADLDWLKADLGLAREKALYCLMAANNETGVIQPVAAAGTMIAEAGHLFHVDAVQMTGGGRFDFAGSLATFAALSSHKAGGAQGVGALAVSCEAQLGALITGGGQEKGRRGGTENVAGIAGFAAAVEASCADPGEAERIAAMRDRCESLITARAPEVTVWGGRVERLPGTLCLSAPGWASEIQVIAMDLNGFAVSAGSACSSGKVKKSQVLEAMGAPAEDAASALRVSFGWTNTMDEAEAFANAWLNEYARVRPRAAAVSA